MASGNTLHIVHSSQVDDDIDGKLFNIETQLKKSSEEERERIFSYFTDRASNVGRKEIPLFSSIWPYLVLPGKERGSIIPQMLVINRLSEYTRDCNLEKVKTHDLPEQYEVAIDDFCRNNEISCIHQRQESHTQKSFLRFRVLLFLFDQLISLILSKILYRNSGSQIAISPYPGRFESTKPIINKLSIDTSVIPTHLTISWLFKSSEKFKNAKHVRPINTYTSTIVIFRQIKCILGLIRDSTANEYAVESSLTTDIDQEFDLYLPNCVHYATDTAIRNRLRHILNYYNYQLVCDFEDCSAMLVGGDTPRDRFALAAADEKELQMYYVPHSIICGYEILPAQETAVQFLEGQYAVDFLKASLLDGSLPILEPTGRAYFERFCPVPELVSPVGETPSVLIATQPFDDEIREKFVIDVLTSIEKSPLDFTTKIKIHPSEEESFYEEIVSTHQFNNVSVQSGDIYEHLEHAELIITINSNVGLEGILTGAGVVSYNIWDPIITVFPYIKQGPIPLASTSDQLNTFFADLTTQYIQEMSRSQLDFFRDNLELENSSKKTAEYIENRS